MKNKRLDGVGYGKNPDTERVCRINGVLYKFTSVHSEYGYLYGYYPARKKWAQLDDKFIQFEGEKHNKNRWLGRRIMILGKPLLFLVNLK